MDNHQALEFLRQHQPMPPDLEITADLIGKYREALSYFVEHPDIEAVPLFLGSFGNGDGLGNYMMVSEILEQLPVRAVIPYLVQGLESESAFTRYWSADLAMYVPDPELIAPLRKLLKEGDLEERDAAVIALSSIRDHRSVEALLSALEDEVRADIASAIRDALSDLDGV